MLVGGHDPTGAAGVDVDRATAAAFEVEACVVVTAETDQDDAEVRALGARPAEVWSAELSRAAENGLEGLKFGLLPGAAAVAAAAAVVRGLRTAQPELPVVVDPVLAASSGGVFLDGAGVAVLCSELLACGVVLTPNLPEAARLTGADPGELASQAGRLRAGRALLALGARAVLLKGGHAHGAVVQDLVLAQGAEALWVEHPRVRGALRGTGCRFATGLTAGLARGLSLVEAARAASAFVAAEIRAAE